MRSGRYFHSGGKQQGSKDAEPERAGGLENKESGRSCGLTGNGTARVGGPSPSAEGPGGREQRGEMFQVFSAEQLGAGLCLSHGTNPPTPGQACRCECPRNVHRGG